MKEVKELSRDERIKKLKGIQKVIFDILVTCPNLRETKYELVYQYWLDHVRFIHEKSVGDFELDFIAGLVQCETVVRAQRKIKSWFPELGPQNKDSWQQATEAHLQFARMKSNPSQTDLLGE